jgi:hypothetical protein
MIATNNKMTNLQLELLRMFKYDLNESQLVEVRELLASYFADKVDSEMEKVCNEKEWSISTIETLANKHTRTSYN